VIVLNEIVTVISTVGFPAAMCILMGYYIMRREEEHGKEMAELKKAINNNTSAISKLVERLRGE
jgi:hypothetical protein